MGSFNKARAKGVGGKAGTVATVAGMMGDMRGKSSGKAKQSAPAQNAPYQAPEVSNFEEEIKRRKKKPTGGTMGSTGGGGYGGSTILG